MTDDLGGMVTHHCVYGKLGDGTPVCWLPGECEPSTETNLRKRAGACEGDESDGLRRLYVALANELARLR